MKEKIYIIFKNNEEEYDDYADWIIEIYKDKERAEKRFVELVKTNQYKKDRVIRRAKYNEDIGAYRIEEHEIENEIRQNEVVNTNCDNIEELKRLFWADSLTQYGKRKLINYYEQQEKDYKRVIKENEYMHNELDKQQTTINKYAKENEEWQKAYQEEKDKQFDLSKEIKELETQYLLQKDLINSNEYIAKQKIKEKIEELSKTKGDLATHIAVSERIRTLQELL